MLRICSAARHAAVDRGARRSMANCRRAAAKLARGHARCVASTRTEPLVSSVDVRASPLHGSGLFAQRSVPTGECVLSDAPLALIEVPSGWSLAELHTAIAAGGHCERLVSSGIYRGEPSRPLVREYHEWAAAALAGTADAMLVVVLNAYTTRPSGRYQAVYPVISKANHSCAANARVRAHDHGAGEIVATQPIAAGGEVTVSYLTNEQLRLPAARRRRIMSGTWDFACVCPRCEAEMQLTHDALAHSSEALSVGTAKAGTVSPPPPHAPMLGSPWAGMNKPVTGLGSARPWQASPWTGTLPVTMAYSVAGPLCTRETRLGAIGNRKKKKKKKKKKKQRKKKKKKKNRRKKKKKKK
eukprot:NODE_9891_length_1392_cov_5.509091.p1 GENE.NODE_9891_length_1392_cov_5.509091~~NODE_9891_length_1392_cov_5.509091.p1  ORF type:complete len:356 (+),score=104.33 NODE_9891_length_1392_cov_5.509091:232-1299(+)